MNENALDLLGRIVTEEIRDNSIRNIDRYLEGNFKGKYAKFVRSVFERNLSSPESLMREMIPLIVDETIDIFLQVLDLKMKQISIHINMNGKSVSPYEFTDALEAEYLPDDGWVANYSKERRTQDVY